MVQKPHGGKPQRAHAFAVAMAPDAPGCAYADGMACMRPPRDTELIQIVDAALADAAARSGSWLACAPGCSQCCHGVFAISALDAMRLRDGLAQLLAEDPARGAGVRQRAEAAAAALRPSFPGDPVTGVLAETTEAEVAFAEFANDEPCPALDPATGTCDLYAARPLTCRVFGPPVLSAEGLGMCELCFVGAPEHDILAATMRMDHGALEDTLTAQAETMTRPGATIVAFALCD